MSIGIKGDLAIGGDGKQTTGRTGDTRLNRGSQGIAIDISVVVGDGIADHAGGVVFVCSEGVIVGNGIIIHRSHRDRDGVGVSKGSVGGQYREVERRSGSASVVVGSGRISDRGNGRVDLGRGTGDGDRVGAVVGDGRASAGDDGEIPGNRGDREGGGQIGAIDIGNGNPVDHLVGVLECGLSTGNGVDRWVIDGRDVDRDGSRLGDSARGDGVGERIWSVLIECRGVSDLTVGQESDRALGTLGDRGDDSPRVLKVVSRGAVGSSDGIEDGRRVFVGGDGIGNNVGDGSHCHRNGVGVCCGAIRSDNREIERRCWSASVEVGGWLVSNRSNRRINLCNRPANGNRVATVAGDGCASSSQHG